MYLKINKEKFKLNTVADKDVAILSTTKWHA